MQQLELETANKNSELADSETFENVNDGVESNSQVRCGAWCMDLPEEIRRELKEDPALKDECIESIRSWITNNEEFYGRTDDSFILRFLRVCKFDLDKTKSRIQRNYQVRHKCSKYFQRTEETERMMDELIGNKFGYIMNFAGNCKENLGISYSGGYLEKYKLDLFLNTATAQMTEIFMEDPRCQVNGVQLIIDCSGMSLSLFWQATPSTLWRAINLVVFSAAVRIKGIHLINIPRFAMKIVYLLKFFLGKKLRERLHLHKDLDSLHQHVLPEYLPLELGGSAGPEQKFIDSTKQWFKNGKEVNTKNESYGINKYPQESVDMLTE